MYPLDMQAPALSDLLLPEDTMNPLGSRCTTSYHQLYTGTCSEDRTLERYSRSLCYHSSNPLGRFGTLRLKFLAHRSSKSHSHNRKLSWIRRCSILQVHK